MTVDVDGDGIVFRPHVSQILRHLFLGKVAFELFVRQGIALGCLRELPFGKPCVIWMLRVIDYAPHIGVVLIQHDGCVREHINMVSC